MYQNKQNLQRSSLETDLRNSKKLASMMFMLTKNADKDNNNYVTSKLVTS